MRSKLLIVSIFSCLSLCVQVVHTGSFKGRGKEKNKKIRPLTKLLILRLNPQETEKLTYKGDDNKTYVICDPHSHPYSLIPILPYHDTCPSDMYLTEIKDNTYTAGNNEFVDDTNPSNEKKYLVRTKIELTKDLSKNNNTYFDAFNNDVTVKGKNIPGKLILELNNTVYIGDNGERYKRETAQRFVQEEL